MRVMVKIVMMAIRGHCSTNTLRNLPKPVNCRGSEKYDAVYSLRE